MIQLTTDLNQPYYKSDLRNFNFNSYLSVRGYGRIKQKIDHRHHGLAKKIHHTIYDHMKTHEHDQCLEDQLAKDGYISVTFSNMNLVKDWILKRTITIESMRKVDSYLKNDVENYNTLKRPERPRDITLRFTWMEQLG